MIRLAAPNMESEGPPYGDDESLFWVAIFGMARRLSFDHIISGKTDDVFGQMLDCMEILSLGESLSVSQ